MKEFTIVVKKVTWGFVWEDEDLNEKWREFVEAFNKKKAAKRLYWYIEDESGK